MLILTFWILTFKHLFRKIMTCYETLTVSICSSLGYNLSVLHSIILIHNHYLTISKNFSRNLLELNLFISSLISCTASMKCSSTFACVWSQTMKPCYLIGEKAQGNMSLFFCDTRYAALSLTAKKTHTNRLFF